MTDGEESRLLRSTGKTGQKRNGSDPSCPQHRIEANLALSNKDNSGVSQESHELSGMDIIRLLFAKILAIILSLAILIVLTLSFGAMAGFFYDLNHAIPDPVVRGDDLGGGIIIFISMVCGFTISLFLFVPLNRVIYYFIRSLWRIK